MSSLENIFSEGRWVWLLLALGVIFRLIWPADMEWKYDEITMFQWARHVAVSRDWPWRGLTSGVSHIPNPPLGLWFFALMGRVVSDPVTMVKMVQTLNVLALLGFFFLALRYAEPKELSIWCWGIALAAVSPLAILFSRKLWAQDVMPIFSLLTLWAHLYRHQKGGAFFWGCLGAALGQVHMSGFYYAFALFICTVLYDRLISKEKKTRWVFWVLGTCLGAIPLIFWMYYYLIPFTYERPAQWKHLIQLKFYFYWMLDAVGIHLKYTMKHEFWEFIKYPYIFRVPTYGVGFLHVILGLIGIKVCMAGLLRAKDGLTFSKLKDRLSHLSLLDFYLCVTLGVMGLAMSVSLVKALPHYLIVTFPFIYMWYAKLLYPRKTLFVMVLMCQMLLSGVFLVYVHTHEGVLNGDYGKTYRAQMGLP